MEVRLLVTEFPGPGGDLAQLQTDDLGPSLDRQSLHPSVTMLSEGTDQMCVSQGTGPVQADEVLVQPGLALSECDGDYSSQTTGSPIESDGLFS